MIKGYREAQRYQMDVLVCHPSFGSRWLENAIITGNTVSGYYWNDSERGSPFYPDDYRGMYEFHHYPASMIRKKVDKAQWEIYGEGVDDNQNG